MDGEFIKIIIFLPLVLILAYFSLKIGGGKMMGFGGGRIIKIVEKTPVSNKAMLCVALINGKPYVISSSEKGIEVVMELPPEALDSLKKNEGSFKYSFLTNLNQLLKRKGKP